MTGMVSHCKLPTELIFQILGYTSARDVIRWRTVSKLFCAITQNPGIWKDLHTNASFMRPLKLPPIRSCLERALVKSERLAQSWIRDPFQLRILSQIKVNLSRDVTGCCDQLIGGRWLIFCVSKNQFMLHDTRAHTGADRVRVVPRVLWQTVDKIVTWDIPLGTSLEGRWVAYVILRTERSTHWSLLELWWDVVPGLPCDAITRVIPCNMSYQVITRRSEFASDFHRSRFLYLPGRASSGCVFDTTTRIFYEFPEFRIALDQTRTRVNATIPIPRRVVLLTNMHVITLRDYPRLLRVGEDTLAQAFTIPDNPCAVKNGKGVLRLSHEGTFESRKASFIIMRNSVVDSINGSINVRLLEGRNQSEWHSFQVGAEVKGCIDLTFQKPSPVDVSSMTIRRLSIVTMGQKPVWDAMGSYESWDFSGEGYMRGLSIWNYPEGLGSSSSNTGRRKVVKCAIDATGDQCVCFVDSGDVEMLPEDRHVRSLEGYHKVSKLVRLDGGRGRLHYIYGHSTCGLVMMVVDIE